ncbi:MAG: hypothetical protein HYV28_14885 [Ignavibacteriales bacterium]|nr:hypothetical protein [Ignavibacteriales bacterium]
MIYNKLNDTVAKERFIITGTQPKPTKQRTPVDPTLELCYFCWQAKDETKHKYFVEKGTIVGIADNKLVDIKIPQRVKYRPDAVSYIIYNLRLDEFGNTPEQAIENML